MHGPEEDDGVVEVRDAGHDHVGGGRVDTFGVRAVAGEKFFQPFHLYGQDPVVDLVKQVVFRAEVVIHRALGHAGGFHHLLDRGTFETLLGEKPGSGLQQPAGHARTGELLRRAQRR
nr:hypothetical protein [Fodinicola feengrottensis]